MTSLRFRVTALGAMVMALLASGQAYAGGQNISGKKLLLKSSGGKEKIVLLSKDASVAVGANGSSADPRCYPDGSGWGGAVTLDDGTNLATMTMHCLPSILKPSDGWSSNGSGTQYKFKGTDQPLAPKPGPKISKIKSGQLKVVGPDLAGFPIPNGPATIDVKVRVGLDKYCMSFTGEGDGTKFQVKDAPAGTACPSTPGCSGELVNGVCWHVGDEGESCDQVCAGVGLMCDPATITVAGSGGTLAACLEIVNAVMLDTYYSDGTLQALGLGCTAQRSFVQANDPPQARLDGGTTTCGAAEPGFYRVCACM